MKEKLIEIFKLKYVAETKWNLVYQNDDYILVYNKITRDCKLKYNIHHV